MFSRGPFSSCSRSFRALSVIPSAPGCAFLAVLLFLPPAYGNAQQVGSLSGVILDDFTGAPLTGVGVEVVGRGRSTVTDREGRFSLAGLPTRSTVIRLHRRGYVTEVHSLEPEPGPGASLELRMVPLAVLLQELTVRTERPSPPETEVVSGNRTRITEAELRDVGGTVADLLQGRVPGLQVGRTSQLGGVAGVCGYGEAAH